MGFPLFRVTLSNDIAGTLVISEPGGWDDAKMKLERNAEYHSLVEFYDQPLTFYGEDMSENGGIQYIRNIEQTQGVDAQIGILVELSQDEGDTWEQVVNNILSVDTVKETDFYLLEMGVLRNDFWQKFINRKATPVDLASAVDLDGEARTVINPVDLQMISQKIRSVHSSRRDVAVFIEGDPNAYLQYDNDNAIVDEVEIKYNLFPAFNTSLPVSLWDIKYDGTYVFDLQLEVSIVLELTPGNVTVGNPGAGLLFFQLNDETPIAFGAVANGSLPHISATYTYQDTLTLQAGDQIRIYGEVTTGVGTTEGYLFWGIDNITFYKVADHDFGNPPSGSNNPTFFSIIADTEYTDTTSEGFLIHEAGNAITDRIIGRDGTFYSEYLGNQNTQIQNYDADGCGSNYALTRGLNVRGYTLAEKPFFMSFDTWWNGINPLLNLGLGYETLPDSPETEVLRIEPKSYFYDKSSTSVDFDFVNNIERSYDLDYIFKAIEIGFEKWSAESASGVDDPQTKRVYNTRFKTVGKEIRILSKFIGASLAIEQTRRNRVEQGKDWRLDEDVMIIAINPDGSPEYQPELDENFSDVTGLLNADTRYNIRLSVARNFERWKSFFNGCLQWYVNNSPEEEYKFASGEGNFDMVTTIDENDCEGGGTSPEPALSEKQNIDVTDDFLFMPIAYKFEHPLEWDEYKAIRGNRHKAIKVSRTDSDHVKCFIMNLEYQITRGKGIFTVVLGENDPL